MILVILEGSDAYYFANNTQILVTLRAKRKDKTSDETICY